MESATSNDIPVDINDEKTVKLEEELPQIDKTPSDSSSSLLPQSQVEEEKVEDPQNKAESVPDYSQPESNVLSHFAVITPGEEEHKVTPMHELPLSA